jgi:phosphatidylglycerophosphate synthase
MSSQARHTYSQTHTQWCIREVGGSVEHLDTTPSHRAPTNDGGPYRPDRKKRRIVLSFPQRGAVVPHLAARQVMAMATGTELAILVSGALCLVLTSQAAAWPRYLGGALAGTLALHLLVVAIRRRVGREPSTLADLLTRGRFAAGTLLVALVVAGFTARTTLAGGIVWAVALLAATLIDWLDGPLARRLGPTRLGAALDIEADSWLTLSAAGAAVFWGGLPWWVLVPPLVRYIHPIRAWLSGGLPAGGGPWWARGAGVAQMTLLLAALAPVEGGPRDAFLVAAAYPAVGAQLLTVFALLIWQIPAAHPQATGALSLLHDEEQ